MLNFIVVDLQLYKIFKIMRVLFLGAQCVCVCVMSVAFHCLDAYNTGSLHYAEMFHFYKLLFADAVDDDSVLQLSAAAVRRGTNDIDNPVGITFTDFDQASPARFVIVSN